MFEDGQYPQIHRNGMSRDLCGSHSIPQALKCGDQVSGTIALRFDLRAGECDLYYNGERITPITSELPSNIYLAVSVLGDQLVFRSTLVEVI